LPTQFDLKIFFLNLVTIYSSCFLQQIQGNDNLFSFLEAKHLMMASFAYLWMSLLLLEHQFIFFNLHK